MTLLSTVLMAGVMLAVDPVVGFGSIVLAAIVGFWLMLRGKGRVPRRPPPVTPPPVTPPSGPVQGPKPRKPYPIDQEEPPPPPPPPPEDDDEDEEDDDDDDDDDRKDR